MYKVLTKDLTIVGISNKKKYCKILKKKKLKFSKSVDHSEYRINKY